MRPLLALVLLGSLTACSSQLPEPDPRMAWVDMSAEPGDTLMANRLDGVRWNDGRYFQVLPGKHELELRYQFEVGGLGGGGGGGMSMASGPFLLTCHLKIRYEGFSAGQHYRIEARSAANRPTAWLYGDNRQVLARSEPAPHCGAF